MKDIFLGIDIGKKGGIAVYSKHDTFTGFLHTEVFSFVSLVDTYKRVKELISLFKPCVVVTGKPNRMYNIIMSHMPYVGVVNLATEKAGIEILIINDSTMRKDILGNGNGHKKELVHEKYKGITPDVSDAMMFAEWGSLQC